ncbi:hypothetical protein GCM10027082_21970 [Comamonas humi]
MGDALLAAQGLLQTGQDEAFGRAKIATARFYGDHVLVRTQALRDAVLHGGTIGDGARGFLSS